MKALFPNTAWALKGPTWDRPTVFLTETELRKELAYRCKSDNGAQLLRVARVTLKWGAPNDKLKRGEK